MSQRPIRVAIGIAMTLLAVACGSSTSVGSKSAGTKPPAGSVTAVNHPGGSAAATRTVEVTMSDIKFDVSQIAVRAGETVRFVFHNQGHLVHEAIVGDAAMQDAHEKEMGAMGAMGAMGSHDAGAVTVDPGKIGQLTYTFKDAGHLLIGCHEPGHYAAGMKIDVNVA